MVENKSVDPAEIMEQIRRRIVEEVTRKKTEQITSMLEIMAELAHASPWQDRPLTTSYPYPVRPLALKIRRLIQAEIRWTLERFIEEQRNLNASVTAALRSIWELVRGTLDYQRQAIERLMDQSSSLQGLQVRIDDQRQTIEQLTEKVGMLSSLEAEVRSLGARLLEKIDGQTKAIEQLSELARRSSTDLSRLGHRYVALEEVARGPSSLVRSRQAQYVESFRGRRNVLDVGCGRGEFLQLLKDNGVDAYGIDRDSEMVKASASLGLRVLQADALNHLRGLEDQTLGGVFCSQVIEHMNPSEALEFINLAYRKLMSGSRIVLETVNPSSVFALSEFFRDPTHTRPIHPLTLKFLLESVAFTSVEIRYLNEPPKSEQLETIDGGGRDIAIVNRNIQKLNALLWGPMDYAAIGIR